MSNCPESGPGRCGFIILSDTSRATMIFGLESYKRNEAYTLTPSLYADGIECSRRLWLRANDIEAEGEYSLAQKSEYLQTQITDFWREKWKFNIYLPGRIHADVWIPEEALFVDYKNRRPKVTDIMQCWLKMDALSIFGLSFTEYQIWYPPDQELHAREVALQYQLEHGINLCGLYTIAIEKPDQEFLNQSDRNRSLMIGEVEKAVPSGKKEAGSVACRGCSYLEFCHM